MRNQSKCTQKFQGYLYELKKKEDLETLRGPLEEIGILFDNGNNNGGKNSKNRNKNNKQNNNNNNNKIADTSFNANTITVDDLKRLVRYWKLHEQRGFWKLHPNKEDIVEALLDHMSKQAKLNPQPPTGAGNNNTNNNNENNGDIMNNSDNTNGNNNHNKHRRLYNSTKRNDYSRAFKPYNGDLFGKYDTSDACVYLSRCDVDKNTAKIKTYNKGSNKKSMMGFLGAKSSTKKSGRRSNDEGFDDDDDMNNENSIDGNNHDNNIHYSLGDTDEFDDKFNSDKIGNVEQDHNIKKMISIAQQMYNYSRNTDAEACIIAEGGLKILSDIWDPKQKTIMLYNSAAIANLTGDDDAKNLILEKISQFSSIVLNFLRASNGSSIEVLHNSAKALAYLSTEWGIEERLFREFYSSLHHFEVEDLMINKFIVIFLSNILTCEGRNFMIEFMITGCKSLLSTKKISYYNIVTEVILMMCIYEDMKYSIVYLGILDLIVDLFQRYKTATEYEREKEFYSNFMQDFTEILFNLSHDDRVKKPMIKHGILEMLIWLLDLTQKWKNASKALLISKYIAHTFSSLSEEKTASNEFTERKVVKTMCTVALSSQYWEVRIRLHAALANISCNPDILVDMIDQDAGDAFLSLLNISTSKRDTQVYALTGLCNLLTNFKTHEILIEKGILQSLQKYEKKDDYEILALLSTAIFNISYGPYCKITQIQNSIESMINLSFKDNENIRKKCVTIFAKFSKRVETCQAMFKYGLLDTIDEMIQMDDIEILSGIAIILRNVADLQKNSSSSTNDDKLLIESDRFIELINIIISVPNIRGDIVLDVLQALKNISRVPADTTSILETLLRFAKLECCNSVMMHLIAFSLYILSSQPQAIDTVGNDAATINLMIDLMRGGTLTTQLCAAKALCNLSCSEYCAKVLLKQESLADFIVIAILRTNDSVIKDICATSLFNILSHPGTRKQLLNKSALWALMKISYDCEIAQTICAHVIFNLSFDKFSQKTMLDLGVSKCLSIITNNQSAQQAKLTTVFVVGVLYNLSCSQAESVVTKDTGNTNSIKHGAIQAVTDIVTATKNPNDLKYLAKVLRNLANVSVDKRNFILVGGATSIYFLLADNHTPEIWQAMNQALYFLSFNETCRQIILEDGLLFEMRILMNHCRENKLRKQTAILMSTLIHFTFNDEELAEIAKSPLNLEFTKLYLAILRDFELNRKMNEEETKWDLWFRYLGIRYIAHTSFERTAHLTNMEYGFTRVLTKILDLPFFYLENGGDATDKLSTSAIEEAYDDDNFESEEEDGYNNKQKDDKKQIKENSIEIAKKLTFHLLIACLNFSMTEAVVHALMGNNIIGRFYKLYVFLKQSDIEADKLSEIESKMAHVLRNFSCYDSIALTLARQPELVPLLSELLDKEIKNQIVHRYVAIVLFHLFKNPESEPRIAQTAAYSLLVKCAKLNEFQPDVRATCIFGLFFQKSVVPEIYEDGSVIATQSIISTCNGKVPPVFQPKRVEAMQPSLYSFIRDFENDEYDCENYTLQPYWDLFKHELDESMGIIEDNTHTDSPITMMTPIKLQAGLVTTKHRKIYLRFEKVTVSPMDSPSRVSVINKRRSTFRKVTNASLLIERPLIAKTRATGLSIKDRMKQGGS